MSFRLPASAPSRVALACFLFASLASSQDPRRLALGRLNGGAQFVAIQSEQGWGLAIEGAGMASAAQAQPLQLEFYQEGQPPTHAGTGYANVRMNENVVSANAHLQGPDHSSFDTTDEWRIDADSITLSRSLRVSGASSQGFLSSITFAHGQAHARSEVNYFAPGMIYGSPEHLTKAAIGGSDTYSPQAQGIVQIREDRLPAPEFGIRFPDGSALTVLDPAPDGRTTKADSNDTQPRSIIDERLRFGALGAHLENGKHEQGFWFPGSEGEVTYKGNTYPGGQLHSWRRRYHPIHDGFTQQYRLIFRFSRETSFPAYMQGAWRWAYQKLNPPIVRQDLAAVERSLVDLLASQVEVVDGRAGIPNFVASAPSESRKTVQSACMGFTGKQLETAELLLANAGSDHDPKHAAHDRELALAMFQSSLKIAMNPPAGECFSIATGEVGLAIPRDHRMYLRSFTDDLKSTMRAYRRERLAGRLHPEWLAWVRQFADWLLTQQNPNGGFPRSWRPGTSEVLDASPQSSYNAVPLLVLLSVETGEAKYLQAAEKAAQFTWNAGQANGQFVGGTIDNPDILDKEAGTLSLEAFLALFETTHRPEWLARAKAAADYAETYIYLWNIPMPADEDDAPLHWKKGVPTYGTQLIATGHSLVDEFMSFNVGDYSRIARWSGDAHYASIATLLLDDTKSMTAIPGRTFDLNGPGWQQEHWSFAPVRGFGLHRGWLPWVATSQLEGIVALREFDPALYTKLSSQAASAQK